MITLKSPSQIEIIGRAGAIIGALLDELRSRAVPGASTDELDAFAEAFIRGRDGAVPSFKGLYGFPATLCTSLNQEVVHGIPSADRVLEDGDILSVDVGVRVEGWNADAATTIEVGEMDDDTLRLLRATREALDRGIAAAVPGDHVGDIGAAIEVVADDSGLGVIRELVGHGVGRKPHEDPQVPNHGTPGRGPLLREGMVLAIEPMFSLGEPEIRTLPDEWTVVTRDGSRTAHYEHTVALTADGPRILTGGAGDEEGADGDDEASEEAGTGAAGGRAAGR